MILFASNALLLGFFDIFTLHVGRQSSNFKKGLVTDGLIGIFFATSRTLPALGLLITSVCGVCGVMSGA
jgi:hypothetical protein